MEQKLPNEYQARQTDCRCLTDERRAFIDDVLDRTENFPDGAFLACLEEEGIDVSELECYSTDHDCAAKATP